MIYFDNCATTFVDKRVLDSFNKVCLEFPGNSNSLHSLGAKTKELEVYADENIKKMLGINDFDVIYTSGASESNNTIIKGICFKYMNRGKHIITSKLEHSSVIECFEFLKNYGFEIDYVNILDNGLVDLEHLKSLMRDDTILVSIAYVDSEFGILQKIDEISKIVKSYKKCFFHVDCTQAIGKVKIDFSKIDLASISGHKIFGLKGIGAIIKKKNIDIMPLIHGGKSTTIYRSGTPQVGLIVSLMKAIELVIKDIDNHYKTVLDLNLALLEGLNNFEGIHINSTENSLKYVVNFSIEGIKPETLVHALEKYEIYVSTMSACSSDKALSSSVLAVTKNEKYASSSIRVSFSYLNTLKEVEKFLDVFKDVYNNLRFIK